MHAGTTVKNHTLRDTLFRNYELNCVPEIRLSISKWA